MRAWDDVAREARAFGKEINFLRRQKGRSSFWRIPKKDQTPKGVVNQRSEIVIFQDLVSSLACRDVEKAPYCY